MSKQSDAFLNALREMRGSAGNGKLRQGLGWDEGTCGAARHDLLAAGAIEAGRGADNVFWVPKEARCLPCSTY